MATGHQLTDAMRALGLPGEALVEPAAGGASGSAWRVRAGAQSYVLRISSVRLANARLAAMAAARDAKLPAPRLIRRAGTSAGEAVLLSWQPGINLLETMMATPSDAPHWGRRMGEMQRRLHDILAPTELPSVISDRGHPFGAGIGTTGLPDGDRLLHLDWHPLNLLADGVTGEICGIVDWDNARQGHPLLDLARTQAILTVEPALASLPAAVGAQLHAFREAWVVGYGTDAAAIPPACLAWAGRVMLADLEPRHAEAPQTLDPLRRWTAGWTR